MIHLQPKDRRALLAASLGTIPCDTVIKNANLVNVFTGEVYLATIYIHQGFIAHVETKNFQDSFEGVKTIIDAKGEYVIPGLIDSHVHIESSMLTPRNFARGVVPHGTTTVITDPHEIANVYGVRAVQYMHEVSEGLPMRQLIDIPSCIPAVPGKETCGANFTFHEIEELVGLERVVGLAEVMDFLAVINGEERMMNILDTARKNNLYLQGHAPFLTGRMLSAYLVGGPKTCHESRLAYEFEEKMRNGMFIDARESSITKNIEECVKGTKNFTFFDTLCLCTDDREPHDIIEIGHMNDVVRMAIQYGMDPILAIKSATINTAREIKIENLGAIAPGYIADIIILPCIKEMKPRLVMFEGNVVAENNCLIKPIEDKEHPIEKENSVTVNHLDVEMFKVKAPIQNGIIKVNVMTYEHYGLSSTDAIVEELKVVDGYLDLSSDPDLKFVAVINRYGKDNFGLGVVRKFGTTHGAIASTVSHDSHNLTVVYDNAENAYCACKHLISIGGGMVVAEHQNVTGTLHLQVGGLMSTKNVYEVAKEASVMKLAMQKVGLVQMSNPLLRIVTLALPVIPNCKMTDFGMMDVNTKSMIPLFVK